MPKEDTEFRLEALARAVSDIITSPKQPEVTYVDIGEDVLMHISWAIEANADTTLDRRCTIALRFTGDQIKRYVDLDTRDRLSFEAQTKHYIEANIKDNLPSDADECALELQAPESLFESSGDVSH